MSVLIFIIILSALVIVHELGHFLVARFFAIRVDEFGIGFPPRAMKLFTWKGTPFTLNWLPFGGFVKIFGENPPTLSEAEVGAPTESVGADNFQSKNRGIQASVLVAGVVGNFIFAWFLLSLGFMTGLPAPEGLSLPINNAHTVITAVLPDSPADIAGLKSGDTILSVSRSGIDSPLAPEAISLFIAASVEPIVFTVERGGQVSNKNVIPIEGIIETRPAVGISMDVIGIVKLPIHEAIGYGFKTTSELTLETARTLGTFIFHALGGRADLSGVTGPIGIVGMVGDVRELGFVYLLTFTALISINLSLINLLPFPALDGGRLLFVIIEGVSRRSISPKVFNVLNTVGFVMIILLSLVITLQDVRRIFP